MNWALNALMLLMFASDCAWADEAVLRQHLAERMPGLPSIDEVRPTPVAGLFEVRIGTEVFYADEQGDHLVRGQILDTRTQANLTQQRIDQLTAIDFASLPLKDAVVWKSGTGKRKLAIFADPNCGYCKRYERTLQEVKDVTVYTFLIPILGGDSPQKASAIWCSRDRTAAWRAWMLDGTVPMAAAACDTSALERNVAVSRKHRITGTPSLVFEDGRRISGMLPLKDTELRLDKAASKGEPM